MQFLQKTKKGETAVNEYRIKISVRNNLLLSAIEAAGYKNQAEFARSAGLHPSRVNELTSLRGAPIGRLGEFTDTAKIIMETLGACPSDLWTDKQMFMELDRNTGERPVSGSLVQHLLEQYSETLVLPSPEDIAGESEQESIVHQFLDGLAPRSAKILRMRFGIETNSERTLEEIGGQFNLSKNRVRQIEAAAIRRLRHEETIQVNGKSLGDTIDIKVEKERA